MASAIRLERFGSNTTKASCLLAVRRIGTRDQRMDWLRIETWGKLAETFDRFCAKGSRVGVKGRLRGEFYNRDGGTRGGDLRQVVVAEQIEFLSNRPAAEPEPQEPEPKGDGLQVVKGGRR